MQHSLLIQKGVDSVENISTPNSQSDIYGILHSKKRLRTRDLKNYWDLILCNFRSEGNFNGLAQAYGKSAGYIDALYYANVIDQENAEVLRQVRNEAHSLAFDRISDALNEHA